MEKKFIEEGQKAKARAPALAAGLHLGRSGTGIGSDRPGRLGTAGPGGGREGEAPCPSQPAAATAALEINKPLFDPSVALLLATEGVTQTWPVDGYVTPKADVALQDAVAAVKRINLWVTFPVTGSGEIMSVAYSPDGQRIVTAGEDGTARIWDTNTREEVHRLLPRGHCLLCSL